MNLWDLFTNAGINIGLATLFLSLFSVFSKQPGNAGVYYTRDLLREKRNAALDKDRRSLESFIPSVGWLIRAWRTTEEDILKLAGLDAVVFLRVFMFSAKLFALCSFIGLFILVPTTFTVHHDDEEAEWAKQDFDRFTINNLITGSNRYWVHFGAVHFISLCAFVMLYMEYRTITQKRLDFLFHARPQPDQFSVLLRVIQKDADSGSYDDSVKKFFSQFHSLTYLSHQMVYDGSKVKRMISKLDKYKAEMDLLKQKPAQERQPRRVGFCGLWGPKVDPLEKQTQKIEDLYQKIRESQREIRNSPKEIPSAIVTFKSRWGAAIAAQSQQSENPLTWVTQWAPEPRDVYWPNLSMSSSQGWLLQILAGVVVFLVTFFYCIPATAIVVGLNDIEDIKGWLPGPLKSLVDLPGVSEIVGGYLSTVLLAALLYLIPPVMLFLSRMEGYPSKSTQERKACEKFFYFLAGPIFFIQVLGKGGVGIAKEWEFIKEPAEIPYKLASSIPGQATFFMSYVMTTGWAGFPLEILNFAVLILNLLKRHTVKEDSTLPELALSSLPYYRVIPNVLLFIYVGLIYAVIAPLLPPFLLVYFGLGYVVFKNQIIHVYEPAYETAGKFWPVIHNRIVAALLIMQVTFVGIFQARMSFRVSLLSVPLPIITVIFWQYCSKRFNPIFVNFSVESTKKKDQEDDFQGTQEELFKDISEAYLHPGLKPVDISNYGDPSSDSLLHTDSLP